MHTPSALNQGGCSYSVRVDDRALNEIRKIAGDNEIPIRRIYIEKTVNGERVYDVVSCNAATTLKKPLSVYATLFKSTLFSGGNAGRGGHKMSMDAVRAIVDTQDLIAQLFNIKKAGNIVFTQNATYALNTAILGTMSNGGHIVVTGMEIHNSVLRPACLPGNYTVVKADKSGYVHAEDVEKAVRKDTKLIVCTHASNVCGTIYSRCMR